ncbi:hypothetical protein [Streptomyces jumonjinensis]|uniref:Uncharacterized protein n=1 Tax=Streptomyces jumonjinensis TaxID=1945 RepID=A0A646KSY2_STRJU|nr:hypothetical protein [Streptomyces jumonjinensis]MQT05200.1 hypothetical protein [Streptomyces jumonjinensis]
MNSDEQLMRGRVYGRDHEDLNPGRLPHRTYAELVGGPLDVHGGVVPARAGGVRVEVRPSIFATGDTRSAE